MKIINRLNIKFKLRILFFILLTSIIVVSYKSIDISQQNKDTLEVVHSKSQTALNMQEKIITPLYHIRELSQSIVMAPNKKIRNSIEKELNLVVGTLNIKINDFVGNDEEILNMWISYKSLIGITIQYLNSEFEEGAYINVTTVSREQFNLLMKELLRIQSDSLYKSTEAYDNAVEEAKEIKIEVFSSLFLILLFSIVTGSLVTNNIIHSIHTVQNGLKEFFEYLNNKREKASKIELVSNDEFSEMAKIINNNVQTIQNNIEKDEALIKNATRVLENIKSGNMGNRLSKETNSSTLNGLKDMINNMIDNLEDKIQEEINKRLDQEQMLIQQSKLASMGEMIGNIAHQWRQPLAQVSAIFMNMKVTYDFDNFSKKYLNEKVEEANKLTQYMSQTINDFQNFFKPHGEEELFSIETACKEALFIIESSLRYHEIKVDFMIIKDSRVLGHKNEYSQVILNILNNAKNVLLERNIKDPYIKIEIKVGDDFAIVKIGDNGEGIDKKILEKIFEPYFTTRHKTQGTGIGLYMSKVIIENNMSGYLNVKNTDIGACFTIKVLKNKIKNF
ncbi:MAG: two-component system C4-dicarboxylate transport sensor histidine kinase DctB [Sulfurimonas sp.]|jgi:two-component system C4-dicarboxylate transport sensor histidine kinase DctB